MAEAPRIIVHAGFHRTGTTSLQQWLRKNRALLEPHVAFYLREDFEKLHQAGMGFGRKPTAWRLKQFRQRLDRLLGNIPDHPQIVLSSEQFSGAKPGYRRLMGLPILSYRRVAAPLAETIVEALRQRFGEAASLTFLYTLRAPQPWLKSVHAHLASATHLTLDVDDFIARHAPFADLEAEAAEVARAIAPVRLETRWLEDIAHAPTGPASALLDLLDLPEGLGERFTAARPMAVSPDDREVQLLIDRNREGGDHKVLWRDKKALRAAMRARAQA